MAFTKDSPGAGNGVAPLIGGDAAGSAGIIRVTPEAPAILVPDYVRCGCGALVSTDVIDADPTPWWSSRRRPKVGDRLDLTCWRCYRRLIFDVLPPRRGTT